MISVPITKRKGIYSDVVVSCIGGIGASIVMLAVVILIGIVI